jgi:hypothetical protein
MALRPSFARLFAFRSNPVTKNLFTIVRSKPTYRRGYSWATVPEIPPPPYPPPDQLKLRDLFPYLLGIGGAYFLCYGIAKFGLFGLPKEDEDLFEELKQKKKG